MDGKKTCPRPCRCTRSPRADTESSRSSREPHSTRSSRHRSQAHTRTCSSSRRAYTRRHSSKEPARIRQNHSRTSDQTTLQSKRTKSHSPRQNKPRRSYKGQTNTRPRCVHSSFRSILQSTCRCSSQRRQHRSVFLFLHRRGWVWLWGLLFHGV